MTQYRIIGTRVLIPLDGTAESRHALQPGLRIAEALGCPVELVTVYDPVNERWENHLDDLAAQLPYEQVEVTVVGGGAPGPVVAEIAAEQPGTLVCMTAMHLDEFDRLALGSVSAHVLRSSDSPILFVGPAYRNTPIPPRYRRLVVCLDGSSRAEAALNIAAIWARTFEIEVELVRVTAPDEDQAELDSIRDGLKRTSDTLSAEGVPATATLLAGDDPAESIAGLLASRSAAFALTATHGRTGLPRLLMGSVTAELLTRSPTPVLVIRSV